MKPTVVDERIPTASSNGPPAASIEEDRSRKEENEAGLKDSKVFLLPVSSVGATPPASGLDGKQVKDSDQT